MEFLVQITIELPDSMPEAEFDELRRAELERGRELVAAQAVRSIWRIPGEGIRNVGIWEARDAAELQTLLASLPMYPWLTAEVTPLSRHPLSEYEDCA